MTPPTWEQSSLNTTSEIWLLWLISKLVLMGLHGISSILGLLMISVGSNGLHVGNLWGHFKISMENGIKGYVCLWEKLWIFMSSLFILCFSYEFFNIPQVILLQKPYLPILLLHDLLEVTHKCSKYEIFFQEMQSSALSFTLF